VLQSSFFDFSFFSVLFFNPFLSSLEVTGIERSDFFISTIGSNKMRQKEKRKEKKEKKKTDINMKGRKKF